MGPDDPKTALGTMDTSAALAVLRTGAIDSGVGAGIRDLGFEFERSEDVDFAVKAVSELKIDRLTIEQSKI
jgi:hypothetical protein